MKPLLLNIPAFLSDQLDTVEGTVHVKKSLTALFTVFFQSGLLDALAPDERDNLIQLQADLHALADLIFTEKVVQKAHTSGALRPRKRSTPQ